LVELLCVIAIITVLAALVLGPASRALQKTRADQWAEQAGVTLESIVNKLQKNYQGKPTFPPVTLADLETSGILNPAQIRFLKDPRVTFTPFTGADSEDKVVVSVQLEAGFWNGGGALTATKGQITKPRR